jgi:hypothetical protein
MKEKKEIVRIGNKADFRVICNEIIHTIRELDDV